MPPEVPLQRITSYLDQLLEVGTYDEGAPSNGLMVDAGRPVSRLAAAVNTSFASIEGSASSAAELMVVHHTTWASIDRDLKEKKEEALRTNGVSLYAAHAALDCHAEFSNSTTLAAALGVEVEGRYLEYGGGLAGAYGRVGAPFPQFVDNVRRVLGVPVYARRNSERFARIAIVPGGGPWTSYLAEAQSLACDTYLTGEANMYTKLFAREVGMNLIVATHYATETFGVKALAAHVGRQFGLPWNFVPEDDPDAA